MFEFDSTSRDGVGSIGSVGGIVCAGSVEEGVRRVRVSTTVGSIQPSVSAGDDDSTGGEFKLAVELVDIIELTQRASMERSSLNGELAA